MCLHSEMALTYEDRANAATQKFYVTTAIAYLNGSPHVGHAYEFLSADIIHRYHKLAGRTTLFLTGADEHGQKVENTAAKQNKTPKQLCDENVLKFQKLNESLSLGDHLYFRTTDAAHYKFAQWIWTRVRDRGDIYKSNYSGWYNVKEETFVTERDAEAHGFKDPATGIAYERRDEECYFFRMSKYHSRVLELVKNSTFLEPETRRNEIVARLESSPLEDLSISRNTLKWGVPVPDDPEHVMYVWFDALSCYASGCAIHQEDSERAKFWPANLHIIGKDITWFHCVIWPAMLMSAELPLPAHVFAHGFVQSSDGAKMSKSLGNVVNPLEVLSRVPPDTFRWYLIREAHYGSDVKFGVPALCDLHNADICDTLGNLIHRVVALTVKNCNSEVPDVDFKTLVDVAAVYNKAESAMERLALEELAEIALDICKTSNKYLTDETPWKIKDDDVKRNAIIRSTLEALYVAAHFFAPIMPTAAAKMFERLGKPPKKLFELSAEKPNLPAGTKVCPGEVLFQRLDKEAI